MNGIPEAQTCEGVLPVNPIIGIEKKCSKCKEKKPRCEFYNNKKLKSGLYSWCKKCTKEINGKWYEKNREAQSKIVKKKYADNPEKYRIINLKYYKDNYEKIIIYNRKWRRENPEKFKKYRDNWKIKNPEKFKEIGRNATRRVRQTIKGRLINNIRREIWASLRGSKNGNNWSALVGYNAEQLKEHLEKQFRNGMNWENYGSFWEIDHIVPISAFNFEAHENIDFKRCWELKNLQPLEKAKNRKKSAKLKGHFQPSLKLSL